MLTGKIRYRCGWWGKVILQVEESFQRMYTYDCETYEVKQWRDARLEDLCEIMKEKQ